MAQIGRLFVEYGCQYYLAGRFGAFAGLTPIVGNIMHHAVEMLLKGALTRSMTTDRIKAELRHHLLRTWAAFKVQVGNPELDRFDDTIATLNAFEDIRYPDKLFDEGALLMVDITKAGRALQTTNGAAAASTPKYEICLEEIDELAAVIFKFAKINPTAFFSWLQPAAREFMHRENKSFPEKSLLPFPSPRSSAVWPASSMLSSR